ncbi:hypothetical protein, partial [Pseudomonas sp. GM50]|uniref:hypothetical protein n=1 Tax=Pseudomonas sp. GM50 TaxID=1144332 RepID=UPI001EE68D38
PSPQKPLPPGIFGESEIGVHPGRRLSIGLIAFAAGCFSVGFTFQNNKNRLSNEPESQPAA